MTRTSSKCRFAGLPAEQGSEQGGRARGDSNDAAAAANAQANSGKSYFHVARQKADTVMAHTCGDQPIVEAGQTAVGPSSTGGLPPRGAPLTTASNSVGSTEREAKSSFSTAQAQEMMLDGMREMNHSILKLRSEVSQRLAALEAKVDLLRKEGEQSG
eukprot:1427779-Prymnesium_polylepis.1